LHEEADDEDDHGREHEEDGVLAARKDAAAEAHVLAELLVEEVGEGDHHEDGAQDATVEHCTRRARSRKRIEGGRHPNEHGNG